MEIQNIVGYDPRDSHFDAKLDELVISKNTISLRFNKMAVKSCSSFNGGVGFISKWISPIIDIQYLTGAVIKLPPPIPTYRQDNMELTMFESWRVKFSKP